MRSEDGFSVSERRDRRSRLEETEKPSELSKRCEKHILIQADDLRGLRDLRGSAAERQNTFFLSVRARTENTSVKNDSLSAVSLPPQERRWGVRKWLKSIGFLGPPVISHKMSACMRMLNLDHPGGIDLLISLISPPNGQDSAFPPKWSRFRFLMVLIWIPFLISPQMVKIRLKFAQIASFNI